MDGWGWHGVMRGPGLLLGCLVFLAVIAAVVLAVWLLVKLVRSSSSKSMPAPTSAPQIVQSDPVLETLRRRLAEGAITSQEFDELRQKLGV